MKKQILASAVAAMMMSFGAQAAIVDLFDEDQGFYVDTTPYAADTGATLNPAQSEGGNALDTGSASIMGGDREIWVSLLDANVNVANGDTAQAGKNASAGVSGGEFSFNTTSQSSGRAQLQWDGAANTDESIDFVGLGGVDLTADATQFALDIVFADAGFTFEITAYTSATDWTKVSILSNEHLTPVTTYIDFNAFLLPSGVYLFGAVTVTQNGLGGDLSNLGALVVDLNPTGGAVAIDLTIDAGRTVPEPATLGLLGIGLLGMGMSMARRRKNG